MRLIRDTNPDKDFSLEHYREIIQEIIKSHQVLSFKEANRLGKSILDLDRFVIMRHDVECSLSAALQLAEIDHDLGVQSTFFLLHTGDYNIFEEEGAQYVFRILELGHNIGLHYDAALFERMGLDPLAVAQQQIALMETFFQTKVYAMSSHLPMRSKKTFAIEGVVDTYDPLYMVEIKYISESTQSWREGIVTRVLNKYPRIHLLTHEYIWHPLGYSWDCLLLIEAYKKFETIWNRSLANISLFKKGLQLRAKKDLEFKEIFLKKHPGDKD